MLWAVGGGDMALLLERGHPSLLRLSGVNEILRQVAETQKTDLGRQKRELVFAS